MPDQTKDTGGPRAIPKRWRRVLLNRWLLAGVGVVALYTLLGFLLTPWLVTHYVTNYAEEQLKRKASIAEVRVNPFLLTLEAKDFVLKEVEGRPLFDFGRLYVDFELSSIFRWAWTFAEIRLERPSLHAEIQPDGRLNLANLAESLPKSEERPPVERRPPRLLLQHIEVVDGSFTFSDRSDPTPATATFTPLNLELREISTLPERKGPYAISAKLPGGGMVGWRGEVSLQPLFSEGELSVAGFRLGTAWQFFQDDVHLAEPMGEVDFSTHYRFDYQERSALLVAQDVKLALKGLALTERGQSAPILALEAIEVVGARFDLQARELTVPSVSVRKGKLAASVDQDGLFNWQKLFARREPADVTARIPGASAPASEPWHLRVETVKVENVELHYTDHSRANPLAMAVGVLNVVLKASAEVGAVPVEATVEGLGANLSRVAFSEVGEATPFLALDTLSLEDGRIDIGSRAITLARLRATGGGTSVVRGKDGRIRLLEMLGPADQGKLKREVAEAGMQARAEGNPWSFALDAFELDGFRVILEDRTFAPAVIYNLQDIRASLNNLTNDGKTPIDFDAGLKVAQGGSATVSGQVSQAGDRAEARVKVTAFNLKPLQPIVAKSAALTLESGNVSASARVSYRSAKPGPQFRTVGSVRVDRLRINETGTGERFLEWKTMSAKGLQFRLSPNRLQIEEVRLLKPGAKVVIFKDRTVNLAKVLKGSEAASTETAPKVAKATAVVPDEKRALFPTSIERVRIEKGVVDFADLSLVLPFATKVTDLNGGVTGISSDQASRASVKFEGHVDEYGLTTVRGTLSPFTPKAFTDITVSFRNVRMTPLSPYSATFAGREIVSGTLNLDLEYKIKNSELLGNNQVLLEQFKLGERVEAPDAVNLPLDLAVALLTNAEGKIDMAVPVSGNVDDPEFSYGQVIWQAITNLITKIVTAPFRLLGGLFGSSSEQLDAIAFDAGSARLLPPEQEKLKNVVEALEKRPQLRLVVQGRFDPEVDGEALRTERVERALGEELGVKLAPDEELGPIAFDNAKTQRGLEALMDERGGDNAVADFETQYEKATGEEAKRVNPALAIFGKASSDTAFYQAMFKELVKLEPLADNDLQDLAQRRAQTIVEEVTQTAGLDATRVSAGSAGPVEKAASETVSSKLTLDVIKPTT